jgi:hypothetical protein
MFLDRWRPSGRGSQIKEGVMKITKEFLEKHGACREDVNLFGEVFPNGASLTFDNLKKAHKVGMDTDWLRRFLTSTGRGQIDTSCINFDNCSAYIYCHECRLTDIWNAFVDGHVKKSIIKELGG